MKSFQKIISLCAAAVSLTSSMTVTASAAQVIDPSSIKAENLNPNQRIVYRATTSPNTYKTKVRLTWPSLKNANSYLVYINDELCFDINASNTKNNTVEAHINMPVGVHKFGIKPVLNTNSTGVIETGMLSSKNEKITPQSVTLEVRPLNGNYNSSNDDNACVPTCMGAIINYKTNNYNNDDNGDKYIAAAIRLGIKDPGQGINIVQQHQKLDTFAQEFIKDKKVTGIVTHGKIENIKNQIDIQLLHNNPVMMSAKFGVNGLYNCPVNENKGHTVVVYRKDFKTGEYFVQDSYGGTTRRWNGKINSANKATTDTRYISPIIVNSDYAEIYYLTLSQKVDTSNTITVENDWQPTLSNSVTLSSSKQTVCSNASGLDGADWALYAGNTPLFRLYNGCVYFDKVEYNKLNNGTYQLKIARIDVNQKKILKVYDTGKTITISNKK